MSYHFLNFKLEDTIKNFIKSYPAPECDVWSFGELASRNDELAEPWIGVRCQESEPHADVQLDTGDGNRYFIAEVAFTTHAEDVLDTDGVTILKTARAYHGDLVGQVLDYFYTSTIKDDLNTASIVVGNISINEIDQPNLTTTNLNRSFITLAKFRILCSPTL